MPIDRTDRRQDRAGQKVKRRTPGRRQFPSHEAEANEQVLSHGDASMGVGTAREPIPVQQFAAGPGGTPIAMSIGPDANPLGDRVTGRQPLGHKGLKRDE